MESSYNSCEAIEHGNPQKSQVQFNIFLCDDMFLMLDKNYFVNYNHFHDIFRLFVL